MKKTLPSPVPFPSSSPNTTRLKIIKGPHKGASYKLVAGKVTIGRSSENDIALVNDNKCSRKQAVLIMGPDNSYSLKDLSNRASIKVNNLTKIQSDLQDGDLIQFGSTILQFEHKPATISTQPLSNIPFLPLPTTAHNSTSPSQSTHSLTPTPVEAPKKDLPALKPENPLDSAPNLNPSIPPDPYSANIPPPFPSSKKQKRPLMPKIILLVLVLAGAWLFLSDDSTNKTEKEDKLKTNLEREEDVKTLTELKEKEQEKRQKNSSPSYKNAQFAYVNGIRDYRKGVYNRAIESFRVCKTLYPQHPLCANYLKKAQVKNQQLIQAWMVAGKDYREKRRFIPCMSSFKNVMMALKDKQHITYKEALENYTICKIQHEDRY